MTESYSLTLLFLMIKWKGIQLKIVVSSKKLTKIMQSHRLLVKEYGSDCAKRISARLDEFSQAENLSEIKSDPPPRCHRLHGKLSNKFAVDVSKNFRMIFEGYDRNNEISIDRSKIVTVQILEICDYH